MFLCDVLLWAFQNFVLFNSLLSRWLSFIALSLTHSIGDSFLSLLPCWHIFERSAEYGMLGRGCRIVYSNLLNFKKDLEVSPLFYFTRSFRILLKGDFEERE